jgi:hypothetical protein
MLDTSSSSDADDGEWADCVLVVDDDDDVSFLGNGYWSRGTYIPPNVSPSGVVMHMKRVFGGWGCKDGGEGVCVEQTIECGVA